jgi:hypothetical protein
VVHTSALHQLKYEALGVLIKIKKGNMAGVRRINEKVHIFTASKRDIPYLQQDSEEEQQDDEESDNDRGTVGVKEYFVEA